MERHLLVTVSEQKSALSGVRFTGNFLSEKKGFKITLLYTAPKPAAQWEGERTQENVSLSERQAKEYEAKGLIALNEAKRLLIRVGFEEGQITTILRARQISKVMDIIVEGQAGKYDAVVLGRRGLSWLEQAFDESVSEGLLDKRANFPLWLCRNPDLERKDVLLCVDGSEEAYRMADHVGFILSPGNKHHVTLLTITKSDAASKEMAQTILQKGKEHLTNNAFSEGMTRTKALESGNAAKSILKEAEQGKFAVVATGRTGEGKGFLKNLFMGSVSSNLLKELEKAALWVCH
jgi:nucleotide-binding universal stress UspA family protein